LAKHHVQQYLHSAVAATAAAAAAAANLVLVQHWCPSASGLQTSSAANLAAAVPVAHPALLLHPSAPQ